jgi:hypothetical protein
VRAARGEGSGGGGLERGDLAVVGRNGIGCVGGEGGGLGDRQGFCAVGFWVVSDRAQVHFHRWARPFSPLPSFAWASTDKGVPKNPTSMSICTRLE